MRFSPNPYTGKPMYYKDNPESVKKRDANRMYVNGKEVSKKHPLHKPGRYKALDDVWSHNDIEKTIDGEVYAITNPAWPNWVKIGKAVSTEDRLNGYQTSSPKRDYTILCKLSADNRHDAEIEMHRLVSTVASNRRGEWFRISTDKVEDIFNEFRKRSPAVAREEV